MVPISNKMVIPPFSFGRIAAPHGRNTPGIGFKEYEAPTIIAPLLPAPEKASISFAFNSLKPILILESGFSLKAFNGCSPILIASGA